MLIQQIIWVLFLTPAFSKLFYFWLNIWRYVRAFIHKSCRKDVIHYKILNINHVGKKWFIIKSYKGKDASKRKKISKGCTFFQCHYLYWITKSDYHLSSPLLSKHFYVRKAITQKVDLKNSKADKYDFVICTYCTGSYCTTVQYLYMTYRNCI